MPLRLFLLPYSREWSYHKHRIQVNIFALWPAGDENGGYVGDEYIAVERVCVGHAGVGNVGT